MWKMYQLLHKMEDSKLNFGNFSKNFFSSGAPISVQVPITVTNCLETSHFSPKIHKNAKGWGFAMKRVKETLIRFTLY